MARDVLAEMGPLALGSRLKRLAERMQADATKVFADRGLPIQGTHFPLLAALATYGPLSVSEAVEAVGDVPRQIDLGASDALRPAHTEHAVGVRENTSSGR